MSARRGLVLALGLAVAACSPPVQEAVPAAAVDVAAYARDVHPILEARCGTLDCKGVGARPLRLYAETGLRAADALRGQPLTAEELAFDARAAAGIDSAAPSVAQHLLLTKPLAVAAGGVAHVGGDLWPDRNAPQALCVAAWLAGRSDDADARAACAIAADQVRLPPATP